jgi:hypothetical protein
MGTTVRNDSIKLHAGVNKEDFERFVVEEMIPFFSKNTRVKHRNWPDNLITMKLRKLATSLVYVFLGLPALTGSSVISKAPSPSEQATPSNFRELSLPAKNFSVLFPDQPKESKELFESEDGQVSVVTFQGYYLPGQYLVMVADYPLKFDTPLKVKTAFDSFIGRTLANRGSEIISQREIKLGTYPGHEVKIRSGDSIVKARMYAVRNRVYSLMLITQLGTMQEPWDSLRFFESLQLTGEWAPSAETEIYRAKSWRFFPEPAEGISVWLPVEAGIDTFYADSAPGYGTYHLLADHDGVVYWLLRMQTSGVTQNRTDLRKSLLGLGQFWSEMLDVKIEGETPIDVNGLHGLSYRIKRGPLTGHARIFLMKDTFVSLWSWPSKPHDSVDDEALFVNSFKPIEVQPGETFDPKARDRAGGPPPPPHGVGSSSMPTKKISTAQLLANVIERGEMESWYPASLANAFGVIDLEITVSQDGRVVSAMGAGGHALLWEKAAWSAFS